MTLCLIEAIAPMLIPMAIGVAGSIGKMFGRGAANRRLGDLASRMPQYKENPLVAQQLGMAQALLNARMPGAAAAERNIYQTQANQIASAERAATDPNQLLLAGAVATGQAQQQFGQLAQQEAADYQRRYGNLSAAQEAQVAEQQRVYEDQVRRYQNQAQIEAAQQENRQNTMGDISNLGFAGAYAAQKGTFDSLFGKTGTTPMGRTMPAATSPSNMLNMGYGQQQPYSWAGRNWLTQ